MIWKCNDCSLEKGVTNGVCPACGGVQTTPRDEEAMVEANVEPILAAELLAE